MSVSPGRPADAVDPVQSCRSGARRQSRGEVFRSLRTGAVWWRLGAESEGRGTRAAGAASRRRM